MDDAQESAAPRRHRHLSHWGAFEAETDGSKVTAVTALTEDADPSPIAHNIPSAQHHATRVLRPAIRRGWFDGTSDGAGRGNEPFVEVEWDVALDLLSAELRRVYNECGADSVYGSSYGWASAGRFHHAQSQIHRFLNTLGGYVGSVGDYSHGVSDTLLPFVVGDPVDLMGRATAWSVVVEHTTLFVAFGGLSAKNSQVAPGGLTRHETRQWVRRGAQRGCRFVSVTPLSDDSYPDANSEWIALRPGTDAALMLALAWVLDHEDLADHAFLSRYCVGYEKFIDYVRGSGGHCARSPEWAAPICEVPAERIRSLAREMAASRTMINLSWSIQRAEHGEQPLWLAVTLAAMLGQIGLPGGGFAHAYGSAADVGQPRRVASAPSLPQGRNPIGPAVPVARVADMLLNPGSFIPFAGRTVQLPEIELVYWCGGNPFHHHQDLARLRQAFARPATIVVHEAFWTSTARHADIVLPATMTIERDDFGSGKNDPSFVPMPALTKPAGSARDDYAIFSALAQRLGCEEAFTQGRNVQEWLRFLYNDWRQDLKSKGLEQPDFDQFWEGSGTLIPIENPEQVMLEEFRRDPTGSPLPTPTGKIEIFSETIDRFGYQDCPGHPVWLPPREWLGSPQAREYGIQLIANQPRTRLHSQLDVGEVSEASKIRGREPVRMNPDDARRRGINDGDLVKIFNRRGTCLAGAQLSDALRPGVAQLSTGAWYDPDPSDPTFCRHGNPNVLTADRPSSSLSQATTGQLTLVEIEPYQDIASEVAVKRPPPFVRHDSI